MRALDSKLRDFDSQADAAVTWLIAFLDEYRPELVHLARGRQVLGHFRFRDRLLYEYSRDELTAETAEELADAIVYISRMLDLRE